MAESYTTAIPRSRSRAVAGRETLSGRRARRSRNEVRYEGRTLPLLLLLAEAALDAITEPTNGQ